MNKRIIVNFIRDKLNLTLFFLLNTFLIILFFSLTLGKAVEIIYPVSISFFLYVILISLEFIKYYKFNSNLFKVIDNINYDLEASTFEQKEVSSLINKLNNTQLNKIAQLKTSDKNFKQFLSQWIHNMKTPVSVIELILEKQSHSLAGESTAPEVFESIKEENSRLYDNLEQALSFMRLEDFSRDYVPEAVDLLASVKKVINSRKNQFIYSNVFPKLACDQDKLNVLTDMKWNEVMLDQIISNAIKYSDSRDISKNIYISLSEKENRTILEIRDEGIGIPEYDMKRIFDPFYTGENGRKIKNSSGIGLYICRVISDKLGHNIEVSSEVNVGTSFKITYLSKV